MGTSVSPTELGAEGVATEETGVVHGKQVTARSPLQLFWRRFRRDKVAMVAAGVVILACLVGRGASIMAAIFATSYLVALALWPLATRGSDPQPTEQPWIWYLVNIATLAAVIAFRIPLQLAWAIATPLLFGVVRLVQGGKPA